MTTATPSRSAPPDSDRLRVFVSYSRDDLDFADQLVVGLEFAGFAATIDRYGITGGEDWKLRLGNLIRETHTVVFVLSPASADSETCAWEVNEAARLGQRIIPILCRPLDGKTPPRLLSDLNYIYFFHEPKTPGSGFAAGLVELTAALNTDIEWHREHTRILLRAMEWDEGGRQSARLLSGTDIQRAKEWAGKRPRTAPEPTDLQLAFIAAGEEEAVARSNVERLRLAEMAKAQEARAKALAAAETALKQVADAQRRRGRLRNSLLLAMTLAAGISGWSWYTIAQGNKKLTEEVQLANAAAARAKSAEARALSDRRRAEKAESNAIVNECTASKVILDTNPKDVENLHNYLSCGLRLGFSLIREDRPEDSKKIFSQMREAALTNSTDQADPVRPFFFLLASEGAAVSQCAATEPKSRARSDAIRQLATAANEILQFPLPPTLEQRWQKELEQRWREEAFRGAVYIGNYSNEAGDRDLAFQYASSLVDRLSSRPGEGGESIRDLVKALDHLVWMALITKRASEALEASERAVQLVEKFDIKDLDSVRLNHAHALLFNGRNDDARKEYQKLNPVDVAADVENLVSVGLCVRLFDELVGAPGRCTTSVGQNGQLQRGDR
jgi:TIR domain